MLVLSVTAFEDYIKGALTTFLIKNWKPEKTYHISFKPQDIPITNLQDWLKEKSIQEIVDDHLRRSYDKRYKSIEKLLIEHDATAPELSESMQSLSIIACEARNCIVHSSSIIDPRAHTALEPIIPGFSVGDPLDITESILWQLLGALRDSARALDVRLRKLM